MHIKVKHIKNWADDRDCQGKLPLLIRKLIRESATNIQSLTIPTEEQIFMSGWDGKVICDEFNEYVPKGTSVWEFSCDKRLYYKAKKDYRKRTDNVQKDINKKETVYIQVSPRPWNEKKLKEWIEETNNENVWKEVRIYDAQKLEEWLEISPSTEKWFSNQLGIPINGVEILESWWDKWCVTDEFNITPKLVLSDKEKEINILKECLKNNKDVRIRANNIDESLAFLYSVIDSLKEDKDYFLEKCLIIDNEESFDFYFNQKDLILIPTFDFKYENSSENIIFNPLLYSDLSKVDIELKDPSKRSFAENLEELNISTSLARRYARDSGRNLTILKRMLSSNIKTPSWVKEYLIELIDLFFIQSWDENSEGDLEIIEKLTGISYEKFSHKCKKLLLEPDSPLVKISSKWFLKSPKDLLYLISMSIDERDLNKFKSLILNIFEIPQDFKLGDKDFRANKNLFKYSKNIKMGILKSLILLSVYGDGLKINYINLDSYVESVVGNLIYNDCFWIYFNNVYLGLFAEASPTIFVEQFKKVLNEKPEIFINSQSASLIWAIQKIAGDSFLFIDIVKILIELDNIGYNKNSHDSPFSTLRELFIPWKHNTYVSLDARFTELKKIIKNNFKLGWKLLKELLPDEHQISFQIQTSIWRYLKENEDVSLGKLIDFYKSLENLFIENIGNNCEDWIFAFNYYFISSDNFRNKILIKYFELKENIDDKFKLWNNLREIIGNHRNFPDKDAFEDEIIPLERIYHDLEPENFIEKNRWAFDSEYLRTLTATSKDNENSLKLIRQNIIDEILAKEGFNGLLKFSNQIKHSKIIGELISQHDFDKEIFNLLKEDNSLDLVKGYVFSKVRDDESWFFKFNNTFNLNSKMIKCIILQLPDTRTVWNFIESSEKDIQDFYWNNISRLNYLKNLEDSKYYIEKLLEFSRFDDIFKFFYYNADRFSVEYVGEILFKIIAISKIKIKIKRNIISSLLKYLMKNSYDEENLMILEFYFAGIFGNEKFPYPFVIYKSFIKNPKKLCYFVKNRANKYPLGLNFNYILNQWNYIPGLDDNKKINHDYLFKWLNVCNQLLNEKEMDYVYYKIGFMLGKFEKNKNNLPCNEISELIEIFDNESINEGFSRGIDPFKNFFGTVIFAKNNFERKLSQTYGDFAEEIVDKYPITAKILKYLSKYYEEEAYQNEIEDELDDFEHY